MMLTEKTASDPRRANWLTISSMAENIWPEDGAARPSWELEAEILRLTTRLMMRERELRQVKGQLKTQATRSQQQVFQWRRKVEEKDEQLRVLVVQKDSEMQNIVSQLMLFEAELRKEQSRIENLLTERDAEISRQREELNRLRTYLSNVAAQDQVNVKDCEERSIDIPVATGERSETGSLGVGDSRAAVQKLREELVRIRAIQDLTNVRSLAERSSSVDCVATTDRRRSSYRAPQKMKDLKAKRVNSHKTIHRSVAVGDACGPAVL